MPFINNITVHPPSDLKGANIAYEGFDYHSPAKPDYFLYVFNVSERTFADPTNPRVGLIGRIKLLAPGKTDEDPCDVMVNGKVVKGDESRRYRYVAAFPQPQLERVFNDSTNMMEVKEQDGVRFVVDMISPDNLTRSLNTVIDPAKANSIGNDYSVKGLFFSYSNPPAKEDLDMAYARMETYYGQLNEKAATLELTDKTALQGAIQSNPDHFYAATYYGKQFAWAKKAVRPVECPNCGETKPAGRMFHQTSFGTFCVEPTPEAWKAVVMSGNRKKDDVPDEMRWWKEKTS